jgi:hypothetical protein
LCGNGEVSEDLIVWAGLQARRCALNRTDRERKSVLFPIRIDNNIFEPWEHLRKAGVPAKGEGDFGGTR